MCCFTATRSRLTFRQYTYEMRKVNFALSPLSPFTPSHTASFSIRKMLIYSILRTRKIDRLRDCISAQFGMLVLGWTSISIKHALLRFGTAARSQLLHFSHGIEGAKVRVGGGFLCGCNVQARIHAFTCSVHMHIFGFPVHVVVARTKSERLQQNTTPTV